MNGKVNGTMDNPIDTSAPNPPDNLQNEKEPASEGCENATNICENSNNTEDSNHLDSESSPEGTAEDLANDVSNGSDSQEAPAQSSAEEPELPENENSNNIIFLDNNCGNSNESYPESIPGCQVKSDANDDNLRKIMVEKNQEAAEARVLGKGTTTITRITEITQEENSELDSDEESSDEDIFELRTEDTVSINSDSDPEGADDQSQEGVIKIKDSNIIILENEDGSLSQNGNSHDSPSPEVQEIVSDNDDCIMAEENQKANSDNKVQLRRSSRAIKRKRYNDDVENGVREDLPHHVPVAFQRKHKPIVINDTKALVEMAARQMKSNQNHTQKKEPTVVIIDTNKLSSEKDKSAVSHKPSGLPISSSLSAQSLYQSIVARGTTVTPVKSNTTTQSSSQAPQPSILPSLTDDMFVVEAPSFIVPYVYEKPSVKPFREFVDLLGKELDEQKAKEEKELQEKQSKEKEKTDKEKQEKKEKGEDDESDEDSQPAGAATDAEMTDPVDDKKKKKKEKRKRGAEEDDVSWDGSSTTDSEDETTISDEENKTIIIKDKVDSLEDIKDVTALLADKVSSTKSDNYFDCSLGKFFINIGLSLVQEYVQSDLLKQQTRKLKREKKAGNSTKSTEASIASLKSNIEFSKENNAPYSFTQKKCEFCSFKTESNLAMAHHLETPHMKNNVYKCNFCAFEIRSPHDILYHMEAEHNIRGKLERAPAYHQCANCLYEDNGKGKLARHLIPCAKKFKPETNLAPSLEWEPPAKIPKITRSRNSMMGSYQNTFNRSSIGSSQGRQSTSVSSIMPGVSSQYRPRGRAPMTMPARALPVHGVPILRGGVMVRHNSPSLMSSNYPIANNVKPKSVHQPSISITPLPRQPPPVQQPPPATNSKSAFVICEICDGYIKDLEQLRNHMQWIHKVKIHPKMIYNRPPLNCQKCQFRFFTDQGLERHLLGSHGLVTSSMQEAANKGKDAGRCPVCGRVYQWKLLNHVARDHNLTLKPAHLSYKCTVCTATFGMYKQFENHVYSAHSVVAKRVMDKSKSAPPAKTSSDSLLKPLKINDEITIIPQPAKPASASTENDD
ncbi:hypothetical protein PYW07_000490 [Mythimna separata]|uniref:MOG interacting and ectopic P-granules protein 1 n=1 Tax=Mythimna separata TaxID=271217 RepID=A0AAD7Z3S1_MYTSE|nr:hypothetical protein PYW07_000490 [Mythimna separata]